MYGISKVFVICMWVLGPKVYSFSEECIKHQQSDMDRWILFASSCFDAMNILRAPAYKWLLGHSRFSMNVLNREEGITLESLGRSRM
jgi:hypothetical protein